MKYKVGQRYIHKTPPWFEIEILQTDIPGEDDLRIRVLSDAREEYAHNLGKEYEWDSETMRVWFYLNESHNVSRILERYEV